MCFSSPEEALLDFSECAVIYSVASDVHLVVVAERGFAPRVVHRCSRDPPKLCDELVVRGPGFGRLGSGPSLEVGQPRLNLPHLLR
jgi:hypothetical protein